MEKKILYVGFNGFPSGFAQVKRQHLIAKGLVHHGYQVTVLNRYGVHGKDSKIPTTGMSDGIDFHYASGTSLRQDSFLKRNYLKFKGLASEAAFCFKFFRKNKRDSAIIITTNNFHNVVIYALLAKLVGVPSILDNVEHFSSIVKKKSAKKTFNDKLYDNLGFKLADKVICISDFLMNIARKTKPESALLKIPAIVDFSEFDLQISEDKNPYFLYCGTLSYKEVIIFVIEAFENVGESNDFYLYLVCSGGTANDMKAIKERISASAKANLIQFYTDLPYTELVNLYMNSKALLIPLRLTDQDKARFPHKIGEYSASSSPIISTNIGEMKAYFTDEVNALLCENYDVSEFSEKMKYIVWNPVIAEGIGKSGRLLGEAEFDYLKLTGKISELIVDSTSDF